MRKHMKKILIALLALIVLCAGVWRLRPHSLADIISVDESAIISLTCTANISGVSKDGTPFIDNYELQALTGGSKDFIAIIDILNQSGYQQSFQNLFPWAITSVSSNGSSMNANIFLAWGSTEKETCFLTVYDDGKVVVSLGENNGFLVYHATVLGSGEINHSGSGKKRQFWSNENRQSGVASPQVVLFTRPAAGQPVSQ